MVDFLRKYWGMYIFQERTDVTVNITLNEGGYVDNLCTKQIPEKQSILPPPPLFLEAHTLITQIHTQAHRWDISEFTLVQFQNMEMIIVD